jgi:alkaline phosphatase D
MAAQGSFAHGVASGIPAPNGISLWTRVSELTRSSQLTLEVATDAHFRRVVDRRLVVADAANDFTVHTKVGKLKPAHE